MRNEPNSLDYHLPQCVTRIFQARRGLIRRKPCGLGGWVAHPLGRVSVHANFRNCNPTASGGAPKLLFALSRDCQKRRAFNIHLNHFPDKIDVNPLRQVLLRQRRSVTCRLLSDHTSLKLGSQDLTEHQNFFCILQKKPKI